MKRGRSLLVMKSKEAVGEGQVTGSTVGNIRAGQKYEFDQTARQEWLQG